MAARGHIKLVYFRLYFWGVVSLELDFYLILNVFQMCSGLEQAQQYITNYMEEGMAALWTTTFDCN